MQLSAVSITVIIYCWYVASSSTQEKNLSISSTKEKNLIVSSTKQKNLIVSSTKQKNQIVSSTKEKNLIEGVSEYKILLSEHHEHFQVVWGDLREIDIEANKHSTRKCISVPGELGKLRLNVRHALNAAEQLFGKSEDLIDEWKDVPSLIDQALDSGQLELALPIFKSSLELLKQRNTYLTNVIQSAKSFQHTEWVDEYNYVDGRSEILSKICFSFAAILIPFAIFIPGRTRGVFVAGALMCFFASIIFSNWEILSPGKCAPTLKSKIKNVLEILETRKSDFESASNTLDGLHTALRQSIDAKRNIKALSSELASQAEFIDPEHAKNSYSLLHRSQEEIANQVSNIRRINKGGSYKDTLDNLIILQKTYPLLIQNVTVFLMLGYDQVEFMINSLPHIQYFMEKFRFDLAQQVLSQMLDNMRNIQQSADVNKNSINALVASLIDARGRVDEETRIKEEDASVARNNKRFGYAGGTAFAAAATAACLSTGGITCAVAATGSLVPFLFGMHHAGQEGVLETHKRAFERMSSYIKELDKFLQRKASKMNEICSQTNTAVTRMNGLDSSIKQKKESEAIFTPVLTKPDTLFLKNRIGLILKTSKKIKTLISELKNDMDKRYLK